MQYLTERERECLAMVARHMRTKMIARERAHHTEMEDKRAPTEIRPAPSQPGEAYALSAFAKVGLIAAFAVVSAAFVAQRLVASH